MPTEKFQSTRESEFLPTIHRRAREAIWRALDAGAKRYERNRDLPALAGLDPRALAEDTIEQSEVILARLARALRAERKRALSGHWTYDLNRHVALRQAHLAETTRLQEIKTGKFAAGPPA
jgi:hypothetical protein